MRTFSFHRRCASMVCFYIGGSERNLTLSVAQCILCEFLVGWMAYSPYWESIARNNENVTQVVLEITLEVAIMTKSTKQGHFKVFLYIMLVHSPKSVDSPEYSQAYINLGLCSVSLCLGVGFSPAACQPCFPQLLNRNVKQLNIPCWAQGMCYLGKKI